MASAARLLIALLASTTVVGCKSPPTRTHDLGVRPPATARELTLYARVRIPCAPPLRIALGRFETGAVRVVLACEDALFVLDPRGHVVARTAATGWPQVLSLRSIDGRTEILSSHGASRRQRTARGALIRYRLDGARLTAETLLELAGPRAEMAQLGQSPDGALRVAYFVSKYDVRHELLRIDGGRARRTEIGTFRMALASVQLGDTQIVGRLYGDAIGADGDAFEVTVGGGRGRAIPTTRGVRALLALDHDGDGREDLLLVDGWSQHYARRAQALLELARRQGGSWRTTRLAELPGEQTIARVALLRRAAPGKPAALLLLGTRALWRHDGKLERIGPGGDDLAALDVDGDGRADLLAVASAAGLFLYARSGRTF